MPQNPFFNLRATLIRQCSFLSILGQTDAFQYNINYTMYLYTNFFMKDEEIIYEKMLLLLLTVITACSMLAFPTTPVHAQEATEFDYDVWHSEAMQAYETYISLLESKADDSTWKRVFDCAEITRASAKKVYTDSVKGATEEEWNGLSKTDVIDYFTTYCHASNYSSYLRQLYRRLNSAAPICCLS